MTVFTENGWPRVGIDQCDTSVIPGTTESLALQRGIPSRIMKAFAAALNKYVESVYNHKGYQDEGGWTPTNSVGTSNHLGGTAMDYNWDDHPMGPQVPDQAAGWQWSAIIGGPEEPMVRKLLELFTYKGIQLIWWGNDWNSPHDSMHFQMGYGTYDNQDICQEFIDKFIDADGFPKFSVEIHNTSNDAAILGNVMDNEVPAARYASLLPMFRRACVEANINNLNRLAMFCAQLGEESGGLQWQQELASGAEYEGNEQLGNTQAGDGVRFKGRDFIQVTGRAHYTDLSQWAFDNQIVSTPTYFVDNPADLARDQYAFVGVVWYWTVARPQLNTLSDNKDIVGATKAVNGGTHGLQDRTNRWNNALAMGDTLMALLTDTGDDWMSNPDAIQMLTEIHRETVIQSGPSRSFMAEGGGNIDTPLGIGWNTDGNAWTLVLTEAYRLNVSLAVKVVETIAKDGVYPGTWASEDFNKWLATFGQAYCQGLVAEKHGTPVKSAKRPAKKTP